MKGKFINDFSKNNEIIKYFKIPEERESIKNSNNIKNFNNNYYTKDYLNNMTSLSTLDTYITNKNITQKYYNSQNGNNYEISNPINHEIKCSQLTYDNCGENQFFYKIQKNNFLNDQDRPYNNKKNKNYIGENGKIKNLDNNNVIGKNNMILKPRLLRNDSNNINSNSNSYIRNNKNKTYDYIVNQNYLLKENEMNEIFNNIKYINTNPSSSTGNKPKNYKKNIQYHYKFFGNENIIYKNNQLINNGIENKNYKFNKRTIENGIKLYNKKKLIEQNRNSNNQIIDSNPIIMEEENNNKVIKINQIVNMNNIINNKKYSKKNHFFINISPKDKKNFINQLNGNENMSNNYNNKVINTVPVRAISQNIDNNLLRNANSNNINYKINNIYNENNGYINNDIMQNNEEEVDEEIFYDNDNDIDNDDNEYNNNIYMYFTKTEPIKEVNEDMEDSSSENKVIVPKKNQMINKKNITQKLKIKKNKNILLEIKKFEQKLFKKNKTILQKLTTDLNNKKPKNPLNAQKYYSKLNQVIKNKNKKNKYKRCNTENKRFNIYNKIKSELDELKSKNKLSNSYKNLSNYIKKRNVRLKSANDFRANDPNNGEDKSKKNDKSYMSKFKMIKPPSIYYYKKILKNK